MCVPLNAKLPPINTVMSLHILTKQHDAPKTHYLRFQVCLLHRRTALLRMGILKNHCEHIITLCEEQHTYIIVFKDRGWKGKWVPTGCTWHWMWNRFSRVNFVFFLFSVNYAERPILLFVNTEDPCCDYGKLGFISPFGGPVYLPFLLYKLFSLNILSWSKCGLHKAMTWE